MRIYLAARYGRRDEMRGHRDVLVSLGHKVTSRWLDGPLTDDNEANEAQIIQWAIESFDGIDRSDVLMVFTDDADTPGSGRGGYMAELGYALQLDRWAEYPFTAILVGPHKSIFTRLCSYQYADFNEMVGDRDRWGALP